MSEGRTMPRIPLEKATRGIGFRVHAEKKPLVSVIIPSYNHEEFISEAISSVLNQTMADLELVIVDDCSADKSKAVIRSWARRDARVRTVFHSKNMGISRTVNDGINAAKGKYVYIFASDDMIRPRALETAVNVLNSEMDYGVVVGDALWFYGNNEIFATHWGLVAHQTGKNVPAPSADIRAYFNEVACKEGSLPLGVIRRSILETYKIRFDERVRYYNDNLFILELSSVCRFKYLQEPMLLHRVHKNSTFRRMHYGRDFNTDHIKEIRIILARYSKLLDRSSSSHLLRQLTGDYLSIFDIPKARECLASSSALEPNLGERVKMSLWILSLKFAKRRCLAKKLWGLYQQLIVVFPNERRRRRAGNWYFEISLKASVSDPTSVLGWLYDMRPDLQKAYPEARDGDYKRLIQWANMIIEMKIDQHSLLSRHADWYREKSEALGPDRMFALGWLYDMRPDLQKAYPEARDGDYKRLIQWANMVMVRSLMVRGLMSHIADWYREKHIGK
jgi:glycosyltransferase involved in cell wall biosynthesis